LAKKKGKLFRTIERGIEREGSERNCLLRIAFKREIKSFDARGIGIDNFKIVAANRLRRGDTYPVSIVSYVVSFQILLRVFNKSFLFLKACRHSPHCSGAPLGRDAVSSRRRSGAEPRQSGGVLPEHYGKK
jgi:hypothetical protein